MKFLPDALDYRPAARCVNQTRPCRAGPRSFSASGLSLTFALK